MGQLSGRKHVTLDTGNHSVASGMRCGPSWIAPCHTATNGGKVTSLGDPVPWQTNFLGKESGKLCSHIFPVEKKVSMGPDGAGKSQTHASPHSQNETGQFQEDCTM